MPGRRDGCNRVGRVIRPLLALAFVGLLLVLAACGGSSSGGSAAVKDVSTETHDAHTSTFEGGTVSPRRAAPALRLRDSTGRLVDLTKYRGRPVLVTFVYATCPDVCPLIMANLRQVRNSSPIGRRMRVIAVSVDPKGDTPAVVQRFLRAQRLGSFVDYLVGSRAELEPVWSAWQIARQVPKSNPELVEHSALIYGVTAGGELATAYPVNFAPDAISRDLSILAES